MKILNIYFKNINSLEGESRIDFDQPPLADAGVFAITGPNGSGKSSILDAITLGLYGETFKFDRPSGQVMTRQTTECFSEVVFSLADEQFRSTWRVNRDKDQVEGELLPPQMQLTRLNGSQEVLADQPNKVRDMIGKLTGMDFRSFSRSIMLAQGDFAAFLNALDNERLDTLEKIVGTDIYTDYKREVEGRANSAKKELEQSKAKIAAIPVMESAELDACEADLFDFKERHVELRDEKNLLQQQQTWLKGISNNEQRVAVLDQAKQKAILQLGQHLADLAKISANQDVLAYQPDIEQIDSKDTEFQLHKQTLETYLEEIKQIQNTLKKLGIISQSAISDPGQSVSQQQQSIDALQFGLDQAKIDKQSEITLLQAAERQLAEKKSTLQDVSVWLQEHAAEHLLLDDFPDINKFHSLKTKLQELQKKHKELLKWDKTASSLLDKNKLGIEKSDKNVYQLKEQLQRCENELDAQGREKTLEEVVDVRKDQQERVRQLNELLNLAVAHGQLVNKTGFLSKLFGTTDQYEEDLQDRFAVLSAELKREQNIQTSLEQAVSLEVLVRKYQDERQILVGGKPCPLCGSLQHPYLKRPPEDVDSISALNEQRRKLKTLKAESDKLTTQIKAAQKQEQADEEKNTHLVRIRSQWLSSCTRLSIVRSDLEINNFRLMKKMLTKEQAELKAIVALENNYYQKQNNKEKLAQSLKQQDAAKLQLQKGTEKLEQDWQSRRQALGDLEQQKTQCQLEFDTLSDKLIGQLTQLDEKMPTRGKGEVLSQRLESRRQEYQTYYTRNQVLLDEIEKLTEKVTESHRKKSTWDKRIDQCTKQLQSGEIAGLHLALVEKQKIIAEKEKLTTPMELELGSLQQALQHKIAGKSYNTLAELREILTLVLSKSQIEQDKLSLENEKERLSIELHKEQVQLEAERTAALTELAPEELETKQRNIAEKIDIAAHEVMRLENIIREQEELQHQYDASIEQLEKLQQAYNVCEADIKQMSEANGAAFRRKVQGMMAEKLLARANHYLEKISGRYFLHQRESSQGLSLEVQDTQKNNSRRLPKTLSGGESFVVSLSLALALSEMATNGKSVDSLFLDEGFGNLDEEALYIVVSTLKSLQHQGKMVGVISHIKGVKDRIETQIEMSKKPNGSSSFILVS